MKRIVLTMVTFGMMGIIFAQTPAGKAGAVAIKGIEGMMNYRESLVQARTRALNATQLHLYTTPMTPMTTVTLPKKVIPVVPTKYDVRRFIYPKAEIQHLQKSVFDEKYQLTFPIDTIISESINHLQKRTKFDFE